MGCVVDGLIVAEHGLVGCEAEGFGGDAEGVVELKGVDGGVGGEAGLELEIIVGGGDDDFVGDDVAGGGGLLADLCDTAVEGVVGEGVDGKADALAFAYVAYVGFVNVGDDAHLGEVLGYLEEGGGVEAGGYGLAFFDFFAEDYAVDGAGDGGVAEVGLGFLDAFEALADGLLGLDVGEFGFVVVVGADEAFVVEVLVAFVVELLVFVVALGAAEHGLG